MGPSRNRFRGLLLATAGTALAVGTIEGYARRDKAISDRPRHAVDELWLEEGAEPETLDPALANESVGAMLIENLFAGLVELDPGSGAILPALADRWDVDPSRTRYRFHLRKALWSDGVDITASDVVYSWRRILDPKVGSKNRGLLDAIEGAEDYQSKRLHPAQLGIEAISSNCVEVRLSRPVPYFLELVAHTALRPVPAHRFLPLTTEMAKQSLWARAEQLVTSGPFFIRRWQFKHRIDLERSDTYWDRAHVKLRRISLFHVEDASTALLMYRTGELDWIGLNGELPAQSYAQWQGTGDLFVEPMLSTYFYWLNLRTPALKNAKLRQALSLSIDRSALTQKILRNGAIATERLVPPGLRNYPDARPPLFDPERARALLAEAGFSPAAPPDQLRLAYNTGQSHKQVAEAIQEMWRVHLGITVILDNQEWRVFLSSVESHAFVMARMGWVGDYPDAHSFLADLLSERGGNNPSGWSSAAHDLRVSRADGLRDPKQRGLALAEAETLALADTPLLALFAPQHSMLAKPYLKGLKPNILGRHPFKDLFIELKPRATADGAK